MEAFKKILKNTALFFAVGAALILCWTASLFAAFSWASLFFILGGVFCVFWIKTRIASQILRKILLTRSETWALCDGEQIIESSPSFPVESFQDLEHFLHPISLPKAQLAIAELIHDNIPFEIRVQARESDAIYTFKGEPLEDKIVFWLNNVTDRVHLEQQQAETLQNNQITISNLQASIDLLPILAWHRDQHQKISYCNQAYASAVQASPQTVYDEGIELIQNRTLKLLARKAINTNESQYLEAPAIANGERRHFRICEIPCQQGHGTIGVAFDITDLNEARTEIKRLIEAHDEVLAHLSTAIAVYDAEATLQYYNQAYVNLHTFDEDFLKTKPRLDEVLEELRRQRQVPEYADFPAYKRKQLQQLTEQVVPEEELMHLPDERTLRNFRAPHPMGGLLYMYEDVTDYLTLERRNKTLLDAYQTTLDNLFEGVVVIGSDNRLKIFNPSFLRLWNFEDDEVATGHHLTHIMEKLKDFLVYNEEWETYKAQLIQNVTDRIPKSGRLMRKDYKIVNFGYVPLPNGDHLLSYTDTTDTFRVQQALQEKNEALETADRLKSEFIANVSYELRSPLNTIIGFTEILSHQYFGELNERQIDYVNGVLESSNKLLHLVNDILDLASIEAGYLTLQPRNVNISKILQDIHKLIAKRAEANRQYFSVKCPATLGEWYMDERRVKQALLNILSNSIKFTPADGKIILEATINGDELEISVTDTGIGIASEDQSRIFDKFERGKGETPNSVGLGLSLVKNLIELHGGRVVLSSELTKGTTVTCVLPRIPQKHRVDENEETDQDLSLNATLLQ